MKIHDSLKRPLFRLFFVACIIVVAVGLQAAVQFLCGGEEKEIAAKYDLAYPELKGNGSMALPAQTAWEHKYFLVATDKCIREVGRQVFDAAERQTWYTTTWSRAADLPKHWQTLLTQAWGDEHYDKP